MGRSTRRRPRQVERGIVEVAGDEARGEAERPRRLPSSAARSRGRCHRRVSSVTAGGWVPTSKRMA